MSEKKKSSRRVAREKAFQILYGLDFIGADGLDALRRAYAEYPRPERQGKLDERAEDFAWELVQGAWKAKAELDGVIGRFSQHWKITRIAKVDLTILRLGMHEILHRPDIPIKVAINEAVELAKEFGDENSRNFVNGILDAAARAVDTGELAGRTGASEGLAERAPGRPKPQEVRKADKGDFETARKILMKALMQMPTSEKTSAYRIVMGILGYLGDPLALAYLKQEGFNAPQRLDRAGMIEALGLSEERLDGHLHSGPSSINAYLTANHGMQLKIGSKAVLTDSHGREWTL